ncbi:glycosyltransferase family 2 protein [Nocardiopsis sp. HNM0947]|uniref:Glycosyltransferase family 2 protein n=1 Tax=Nocardiopsis coralli TaxID=2772213 RepID=A0ABR9PF18_9ACTN|nr:glycosyltransferase family 2 protein [Nocardiopsis coralli]MBE3002438.1 glycosyltransferase family 2 protein [Nocardiopsis coralli]
MITTVLRGALRSRGDEPAVLGHTGAGSRAPLARLRYRPEDRIVDLDTHPMGTPVSEGEDPEAGLVAVVAATPTDLHRTLTTAVHLPRAAHVLVALLAAPGHQEPPLPSAPGLGQWRDLHEMRVRRVDRNGWVCELFFPRATEADQVLDTVLQGTRGRRRGPAVTPVAALHGTEGALWRPGDTGAQGIEVSGPVPLRRVTPRADLALRVGADPERAWTDPNVAALDAEPTAADSWTGLLGSDAPTRARARVRARGQSADEALVHAVAPIDELTVNPTGFTKAEQGALGDLTVHGNRAVVREGSKVLVTVAADGTVTDVDLTRLRHLRGVRVDWSGHTGPTAAVRAVASLAAGGVPLLSGPVPAWAAGLGGRLIALLTDTDEEGLRSRLRREEHSVRLRRAALELHGTRPRWRALARRAGVPLPPEPTVSVVLCTRRPEMVGFALAQIARQRGVDAEVVLTLHGFGADSPGVASALAEFDATGIPLTVYEADADRLFGAVLNDAVARAGGSLIAKWDDDDWYGPDHLADLLLARCYSGAELVGTGQDFVFLQEVDLTVWRSRESETATRFIAGGTILVDRVVLEETGGFRPLPRAIDTQLLLAVTRGGGRVHRTHGLGYVLRRTGAGHTWSEDMSYFLHNYAQQWSGWRPSALLEGAPAPLGAPVATDTTGETP